MARVASTWSIPVRLGMSIRIMIATAPYARTATATATRSTSPTSTSVETADLAAASYPLGRARRTLLSHAGRAGRGRWLVSCIDYSRLVYREKHGGPPFSKMTARAASCTFKAREPSCVKHHSVWTLLVTPSTTRLLKNAAHDPISLTRRRRKSTIVFQRMIPRVSSSSTAAVLER